MANEVLSPNMNLPVPVVGTDPGPQYAIDIDSCLTIIDGHTHLTGSGVPIVSAAIDINSDLPFNDNNLTGARALRFQPQAILIPTTGVDLGELFEGPTTSGSNGDLYYNDGVGNQIQITSNGHVNSGAGSISGLVAPASASYNSVSSTFIWQSNVNTPANLDAASIILRNLVANSPGLTLQAPTLASDYSITLPTLPSSTSFLTLTSSGVMAASVSLANGITYSMLSTGVQAMLAVTTTGPTRTTLTSTGTATGTVFTVSSANATVGAVYTNNSNSFTVLSTIAAGTTLYTSGAGVVTGSTLTKTSGTGDATITFSSSLNTATYTPPAGTNYLTLEQVGGGGGGGGGNGANGTAGTASIFGNGLVITNGGGPGVAGSGGGTPPAGGTGSLGAGVYGRIVVGGSSSAGQESASVFTSGGVGASGPWGGAGGAGTINSGAGGAATANSGAGGGGGGTNNAPGVTGSFGGAAGCYADVIIPNSAMQTTFQYIIGSAGNGGGAGGGVGAGGSGGSGVIDIIEHYGS